MIGMYIKRGVLSGILLCAGMSLFAGEQQICRTSLSKALFIDLPKNISIERKGADERVLYCKWKDGVSTLQMTLIFDPEITKKMSLEEIKKTTQEMGEKCLSSSVEKELKLFPLKLKEGTGYYYSLTDKNPKPGEYKYIAQGQLKLEKMNCVFTILHNDPTMKKRTEWIKRVESLQIKPLSSASFKNQKLTDKDIKDIATFIEQPQFYSQQVLSFVKNPDAYEELLSPCLEQYYQSVEAGKTKASIYYFKFKSELTSEKMAFLRGLFYGEAKKPTKDHPEIIVADKNILIIYSFPYQSDLLKKIRSKKLLQKKKP